MVHQSTSIPLFQSTPPCRERLDPVARAQTDDLFQSTPPCRERPGCLYKFGQPIKRFNPRPHVGSDFVHFVLLLVHSGFNPRPHVGSDLSSGY